MVFMAAESSSETLPQKQVPQTCNGAHIESVGVTSSILDFTSERSSSPTIFMNDQLLNRERAAFQHLMSGFMQFALFYENMCI